MRYKIENHICDSYVVLFCNKDIFVKKKEAVLASHLH